MGLHLLQPLHPNPNIKDGIHVKEVENIEKDGQPSMHTDLEKPGLKQLQVIALNCNMASSVKVQLCSNMAFCPHDTSSWKLMTTSNSPFVDLIEEFPSKELGLLEVECKDVLVFTHTKAEQVVTMNWQPPPHPLAFLKRVLSPFVLFP